MPPDRHGGGDEGDILVTVRDLSVAFPVGEQRLQAVDSVDLDVNRGRTLGIVGESGSGKSVLVKALAGLLPSTAIVGPGSAVTFDGEQLVRGSRVEGSHLWGTRVAMIFQDPQTSLNPVVKIGRQITESIRHHLQLSKKAAFERAVELLDEVGVSDPRRRMGEYPHQLSGGMLQRVMIAIGLSCEPSLLIADEPTTALDVTVQQQVLELLAAAQQERDMTMIFISHDLGVISQVSDEVVVMYAGQTIERGPTGDFFGAIGHPYTAALVGCTPSIDAAVDLQPIPGSLPVMTNPPEGCRFAARCAHVRAGCRNAVPAFFERGPGHVVRCIHPVDFDAVGGG